MPDAILLYGESYHHPSILYKTGFLAPDPVVYIEIGGSKTLLVSTLEVGRAQKQARVDEVIDWETLGFSGLQRQAKGPDEAFGKLIATLLTDRGVGEVRVEPDFPIGLARALEANDVVVSADQPLFGMARRQKQPHEIDAIHASQRAAQAAMGRAQAMLRDAQTVDGVLHLGGEPLTSARLIAAVDAELLQHGCGIEGTIAAGGAGAADPHVSDSGVLKAGEAVILDIFPFGKSSRYFGDMTRTFVVGQPSETWLRMYDAVHAAYRNALAKVRAGINAREVHLEVCRTLYEAGFGTLVEGYRREGVPAMIHGTGHGVGLEIHEAPRVSDVEVELVEGDVITIEPGLYHPDFGGVRIEDTVVVTADGHRNLTDYPTGWTP
ncbi:MAG TPA: Xaa-Pro peptidase family protein [Candidatus Dormibacteraeota bacterium]|nr:Xaa-Pro peptidase family protein [Candidatus Dormibacteraeota bacterium]